MILKTQCTEVTIDYAIITNFIHNCFKLLDQEQILLIATYSKTLMNVKSSTLKEIEDRILKTLDDYILCDNGVFYFAFQVVADDELEEIIYNINIQIEKIFSEYNINSIIYNASNLISKTDNHENIIDELLSMLTTIKSGLQPKFIKHSDYQKFIDASNIEDSLLLQLKKAHYTDNLVLFYQPIVCCKTLKTAYYECLIRIKNNEQITSIGPYIDVAEKYGFIKEIDYRALSILTQIIKSSNVIFSVNLSPISAIDDKVIAKVLDICSDQTIAKNLIIELTESTAKFNKEKLIWFLKEVRKSGAKVAIDDFGWGFHTVAEIRSLPIDILKIDGSLISKIVENKTEQIFVQSLIEISKEIGLKTVAEYIEDAEQVAMVTAMGIDYMQGYYFGKPSADLPK